MSRGIYSVLTNVQVSMITSTAFVRSSNVTHHHVAVVISNKTGSVLASGTNSATATGSIHAEVAATVQFKQRLRDRVLHTREVNKGVHLLSLRVSNQGKLRLAKPCQACRATMKLCPLIRRCSWSDNDGNLIHEKMI